MTQGYGYRAPIWEGTQYSSELICQASLLTIVKNQGTLSYKIKTGVDW